MKNLKYYFFYLIYLFIVSIILIEIILRFLPTQEVFKLQIVTPENPIIRYEPNKEATFSLGWNFYQITKKKTNNYGYVASKNYSKNAEPDVMVIGDSMVEAMQVDNKETIPQIIEKLDTSLNVYAMGISGVPLSQYIKFIEFAEKEFSPKEYIIVVIGNDFDESLCSYKQKQGTYCFDKNFELKLIPFDGYSLKRNLARNSAFIRYLILNLKIDWRFVISKLGILEHDIPPEYVGNTERKKSLEIEDLSFKVIDEFLSRISSIVRNKKITLIIGAHLNDIYTERNTTDSYFYKMREYLKRNAKIKGLNVIDMRPILEQHFNKFGQTFDFPTDGHWNELGQELAAKAYLKINY